MIIIGFYIVVIVNSIFLNEVSFMTAHVSSEAEELPYFDGRCQRL